MMDRPGKKTTNSPGAPAVGTGSPAAAPPWLWPVEVGVTLAVAVLAIGAIWGEPRPIGDLYAGLTVGQDVMDGKLGQPDDWSYMSDGRVAVNQNWGTHFLTYLVYEAAGPVGLLVLKAVMIGLTGLFIILAARQRKVSWPVALLVAGAAIAAGRSYIDMRANLTTLTVAPLALWLLFKTRQNVHWIWAVMVLNGVWANMHGGFIFGLGMTALWAGALLMQRTVEAASGRASAWAVLRAAGRAAWPLPVAVVGSVLLAGFANPYGLRNLVFPFQILDPAWQRLNEWQPLLSEKARFGTTWEFLTLMGILGGLLLLRVAGIPGVRSSYLRRPNLQQAAMGLFDLVLAAVVIGMTFKARRFVPLSVIVLGPFLAVQLEWLVGLLRRADRYLGPAALGAMTVALGVPLLLDAHKLMRLYDPRNPLRPAETLFERMHGTAAQPVGAAEFLAANGITGRCFNEWRWEGYLRWTCPGIQVFMGGRAHQVYDGATDRLAARILSDPREYPDPRYKVNPTQDLADLDVHLVVVPVDDKHAALMWHLLERPEGKWAYIYFDTKDIVAADTTSPQTAELVRRAIAGDLKYPNEAAATLSRAMAMTSPCLRIPAAEGIEAFLAAARVQPTTIAYDAIRQLSRSLPDPVAWQKAYFQQEYARLEAVDYREADGHRTLLMRAQLAEYLARAYRVEGNAREGARWTKIGNEALAERKALIQTWP
ncbi:MAG: hypothetical protein MUP47_07880 [Phycisphaerae bacterium]|nr:hypothetical protein [Phycisphaerae bacterium]